MNREELDKIVKVERKYELKISHYIVCIKCGTMAYGNGNCHCGENIWKINEKDLEKEIKEWDNRFDIGKEDKTED